FLEGYGISLKLAVRIYKAYGEDLYKILKENPYQLAEDIDGVGFLTADRIAARAGIAADSEMRLKCGILYVLSASQGEGNVYLPLEMLVSRSSAMLQADPEAVRPALSALISEHKLISRESDDGTIIYSGRLYYLELNSARMLLDLSVPTGTDREEVMEELRKMEQEHRLVLDEIQRKAVISAVCNTVLVLTGGPGTGKTTTINEMIRFFMRKGMEVLLAAPTGRAAKRMTEATGYEASTIHRLLEVSSSPEAESEARFERNAENPLEADVIIIDEMSMVDIGLLNALLCAVARGTRLILVGDVDQLPSVGPGAVLRDIIASDAFPTIRLSRIFRQAESSDIVLNAHKINRGEQITLGTNSREFLFLERDDPERIIRNMIELIRDRLPAYVEAKPLDIQVLSPMRKGVLGVERLNSVLQEQLNPPSPKKAEKQYGDRIFRVGDKVMQTRNNYQIAWEVPGRFGIPVETGSGIFNGDMGIVKRIDEFGHVIEIEFDEGRVVDYPFGDLEDLEHAYAVTIHKSQGSEYPAVLIPILSGPSMLMTRNLLYTAVTRAKRCVMILGSSSAVRGMIENVSERKRFTSLDQRIRELCP
ncbi:MAG: AAA family ATPase, partial [Lachnospiraceae bacterium]|nr:AAA family ATPase [Lachnospiraceae bacterium]